MSKSFYKKFLYLVSMLFLWVIPVNAGSVSSERLIHGIPTSNSETELLEIEAGLAALSNNQWDISNQIFLSLSEKDNTKPMHWIGLAMSASSLEEYHYAVSQGLKQLENATDGEKHLLLLQQTYVNGDAKERIDITKKLITAYPKSSWAWIERGDALNSVKKVDDSRKAFAQAALIAPVQLEPRVKLGNSYLFEEPKDFKKAEESFVIAAKMQPANATAHINLGDVHSAQLNLNLAQKDYSRAVKLDPFNGVAYTKLGHVNSFIGNYEQARKSFDKANAVSNDLNANFNANYKAFTHIYQGEPKKSIDALTQHLSVIDKSSVDTHQKTQAKVFTLNNLTSIALHESMLELASNFIDSRETLVNLQLANVENENLKRKMRATNHFLKGKLAVKQGKINLALNDADKMHLLLTPLKDVRKYEDFHELNALISMKKEQWGEALNHFEKANANKLTVKFNSAIAFEQTGKIRESVELFREVRDYNFNSVDFALLRNQAAEKVQMATGVVTASN